MAGFNMVDYLQQKQQQAMSASDIALSNTPAGQGSVPVAPLSATQGGASKGKTYSQSTSDFLDRKWNPQKDINTPKSTGTFNTGGYHPTDINGLTRDQQQSLTGSTNTGQQYGLMDYNNINPRAVGNPSMVAGVMGQQVPNTFGMAQPPPASVEQPITPTYNLTKR